MKKLKDSLKSYHKRCKTIRKIAKSFKKTELKHAKNKP